jgi:hypothetical protein
MSPVRQATHVLSAFLEADGSITMIVLFPDSDQAAMVTIDPIETTIRAAGPMPRRIDLNYGAEADRHLRLIVAMHADALAYEREMEQAARTLCRGQLRQAGVEPLVDPAPALDDWPEALAVAAALDARGDARV